MLVYCGVYTFCFVCACNMFTCLEGNLQFFDHVGPKDWTQAVRLVGRRFYLLNHLFHPHFGLFF